MPAFSSFFPSVFLAIVGSVALFIGLCGWNVGAEFPFVGPALAGFSPAAALFSFLEPGPRMGQTISDHGLMEARISLAIGCLVGAGVYIGIVYATITALVKNFDMTVRKLAGVK